MNKPVTHLRNGYYTDVYFNQAREIVPPGIHVLMQIFQRRATYLHGIEEVLEMIDHILGASRKKIEIKSLNEGEVIRPLEPVMTIEGPYHLFAHLETIILGILSRRTLVGHNVREVVKAARGKPVYYFAARHDIWEAQQGDGYVAHLEGASGVSTQAQGAWYGGVPIGTIPHALIAAFGGSTVEAALAFATKYPKTPLTVLVDYENDCARTAVEVADAFKDKGLSLSGVRLDTSADLVDEGIRATNRLLAGVSPELVAVVRTRLDEAGYYKVRIIVSGGFTADRIDQFEVYGKRLGATPDGYGVGSSLIRGSNNYTADIVKVNGKLQAKVGRTFIDNPRLKVVYS